MAWPNQKLSKETIKETLGYDPDEIKAKAEKASADLEALRTSSVPKIEFDTLKESLSALQAQVNAAKPVSREQQQSANEPVEEDEIDLFGGNVNEQINKMIDRKTANTNAAAAYVVGEQMLSQFKSDHSDFKYFEKDFKERWDKIPYHLRSTQMIEDLYQVARGKQFDAARSTPQAFSIESGGSGSGGRTEEKIDPNNALTPEQKKYADKTGVPYAEYHKFITTGSFV